MDLPIQVSSTHHMHAAQHPPPAARHLRCSTWPLARHHTTYTPPTRRPQPIHATAATPAAPNKPSKHLPSVIVGTPLSKALSKGLAPSYDTIVIGSGMGGLTAAVALSKWAGQRVLVLEQHYTAGGLTHAFQRGQYTWNTGVHYVGGGIGEPGGELYPVFNALTGGGVSWERMPQVYDRLLVGGHTYDLVAGQEAWEEALCGYFPHEIKAIQAIARDMAAVNNALGKWAASRMLPPWPLLSPLAGGLARRYLQLGRMTAADYLAQHTQNRELVAVLSGQHLNWGLPPGSCSAVQQLTVMGHYVGGGYKVAGGAQAIAATLVPVVEAGGGAVVTQAGVEQLLVEGGRVVGVRLAGGQEIRAATVISSAGAYNTFACLVPKDVLATTPALQQLLSAIQALGSSPSAIALYCGFQEKALPEFQEIGNVHKHVDADLDGGYQRMLTRPTAPLTNVFISAETSHTQQHSSSSSNSTANTTRSSSSSSSSASTANTTSSSSGSSSGSGGSTVQVIIPASMERFKAWAGSRWRHRGDDYKELKAHLSELLLQELGTVFPGLPARLDLQELSTPLSAQHFCGWPAGDNYGLAAAPARHQGVLADGLGPRTPLPGLLLAGQDVICAGVTGAMAGGLASAVVAGGPGVGVGLGRERRRWS